MTRMRKMPEHRGLTGLDVLVMAFVITLVDIGIGMKAFQGSWAYTILLIFLSYCTFGILINIWRK